MQVLLDDIAIRLDDRMAFEHTTWHILEGQNWAVIGGTGSGKSLLLKSICRKVPLAHGLIRYSFDQSDASIKRQYFLPGEILLFSPEVHSDFLRRFASYHQARWQSFEGDDVPSAQDILSSALPITDGVPQGISNNSGEGKFRRSWSDVVDMFKLGPILKRRIHHLSHGESRKLIIARLLLKQPRLLMLDDPFTGLDEESRNVLKDGIDGLLQRMDPGIVIAVSRSEDMCHGITHLAMVEDNQLIAQGERCLVQSLADRTINQHRSSLQRNTDSNNNPALNKMLAQYLETLKLNGSKTIVGSNHNHPAVLVNLAHVSVRYGGDVILKDINWTLKQGERWALLGPNGAGKTTLMSLIVADNPQAYANRIELFGTQRGSGESIWQIKRRIGWVSPELHIYYHRNMTAFDVVCSGFFASTGLYRHCSPGQKALVQEWMNALEIEDLKELPFLGLSTGQQRMVIMARALVNHPPLLILDEPCQALDDHYKDRLLRFIDRLCSTTPVSMIYVTHVRHEIPTSITNYLLLDRGKVIRKGLLDHDQSELDAIVI